MNSIGRLWLLGLMLALLYCGFAAGQEEVEEDEEPDDFSQDDVAEDYLEEDTDMDSAVRQHPLGEDCIKVAEALEREVGLFDNRAIGEAGRSQIADKMKEHSESVMTGKDHSKFHEAFKSHLGDLHTSGGLFGAVDACHYLFKHHNEL
mmetsp:Transcript_14045/g.21220  ORF Transcript_14045/g.21220 Transcript_14045/m.21220 type:complete len:148 (+) Transcript_14045:118-561(+)|eukprot:CAMPEP_0194765042 /NCGR_PEP_ID=MMETSP0323_2-20130528/24568_1 /TAXON_ID=2866 ORGANISM="Crypthecodinium cohnii, Strain Seligo" /NCGR_SAMPLE_ID=MMETSP0323_2 /ASSEMBLY_ACC=CAM_ASM_000346 /LENGTH=147 /DNA_ID=CAMNT_0039693557 /DNA_START=101 /DNA_END=544 /DNA_ORIENTATION=+